MAIHQAIKRAETSGIVILGIQPDGPGTGYGYIKAISSDAQSLVAQVDKFVEKLNSETAQRYLKEGVYYWNAGLFVLKASDWLKFLKEFRPEIININQAAWQNKTFDAKFVRPDKEKFVAVPSESVDYAVMEHCPGSQLAIHFVELDAGWSGLGAWDMLPKDARGMPMWVT